MGKQQKTKKLLLITTIMNQLLLVQNQLHSELVKELSTEFALKVMEVINAAQELTITLKDMEKLWMKLSLKSTVNVQMNAENSKIITVMMKLHKISLPYKMKMKPKKKKILMVQALSNFF